MGGRAIQCKNTPFLLTYALTYDMEGGSKRLWQRKAYQRRDAKGYYVAPLYFRVIVNREKRDLSTGVWARVPKEKNPDYTRGLSVDDRAKIHGIHQKIEKILLEMHLSGDAYTLQNFMVKYRSRDQNTPLVDLAGKMVEKKSAHLSRDTLHTYRTQVSKLRAFDKKTPPQKINTTWIESYQRWCMDKRGNTQNTAHKSLSFVRTILNDLKRAELLDSSVDPFRGVRLKKKPARRSHLNHRQLETLQAMYFSNTLPVGQANVLRYFLFACYTGLRFQDIKFLTYHNIKGDHLAVRMHKTQDPIRVPLSKRAKSVLPKIPKDPDLWGAKVFRVYCNQVTNRQLKKICRRADIEQDISFHSARHSFATLSLSLGIPLHVVQSLLGHRELKTTQIYARILSEDQDRFMRLWD